MYTLANINNPMVWVAILGVVVLLFGGQKIPELMKSIAQGKRAFEDEMHGPKDEQLRVDREAELRRREAELERREEELRKSKQA